MIHVQDENLVHRAFDDRIDLIGLGRNGKTHAQEVTRIGQVVLRIDVRLADPVFITARGERWDLGDDPVDRHVSRLIFSRVLIIVIKARERTDCPAKHGHRMAVPAIALEEAFDLIVQHGVVRDRVFERLELVLVRQLAMDQQVSDFERSGLLCQLFDVIAAIEKLSFAAIDEGDLTLG